MLRDLWPLVLLVPVLVGCLSFHKGPMPGGPRDARFADVEGVRVRYLDTEAAAPAVTPSEPKVEADQAPAPAVEKPTVVLVHGFASAIEAWMPVIPVLSKTHRVLA